MAELAQLADDAALRRVHFLAWRDLDDPEAGGSELHADEVAKIWTEAGIEVVMRTSYAAGHPIDIDRSGYRVVRKAGRYMVFPRAALAEIARSYGPRDAVVEIWNGMPFLSPLWTRSPKVVVIHHVHAEMWRMVLSPILASVGDTIERKWAPRLYRNVRVLTPSESSRLDIIDQLGFSPERVEVVHNGVGSEFTPGPEHERPRPPNVLAVGRLVPVKRFDLLIRACADARRRVPDLTLTIVGEGYERAKIERVIDRLGARSWVTLTARLTSDQLLEYYRTARVVASASAREGWGLTITEAAACGTPAVATRVVGHLDTVRDGVSGLLASDLDELADQLVAVCSDDALWSQLGKGAIAHASQFTWPATALGMFRALAAEKKGWTRHSRVGRWR